MDFKLPSSTLMRHYWKEHADFLKNARKKEVFVKSVVTKNTKLSDIKKAVSIIERIDKNIPFVLQPVTLKGKIQKIDLLEKFLDAAYSKLYNVRVIPQVHKILGVR
jgi:organic radical activating enzyme